MGAPLQTNGDHAIVNGHGERSRPSGRRANSLPMNPAFMTSAPGKVIVYGEHAVVHGKAAIAAAISLRSYLLVTTLTKSQRTLSLRFPDIGLSHTWNIDDLPWSTFSQPSKKKTYYDRVTELDPDLIGAIRPHVANVSPSMPLEQRKIHIASATAFLYLLLSLGSHTFPGCIYTLRSTLPIGAGLGSSASICVCLSSALLIQIRSLAGPHPDQPIEEVELQIERINSWAFVGEMCIQGNPSGVDNTVSSRGKAALFRRKDYTKAPDVHYLTDFPELPLLLVNTRQQRSTATEVAKVAVLKKTLPAVTDAVLDAIDQVTETAHSIISSPDYHTGDNQMAEKLGELMRVNHGLLLSLGVSHPRLERIRELVDTCQVGWTKLTGAGGGGSAITLLRQDAPAGALSSLHTKLEEEGFERFETTLGGDGVGVLWPAVLKHGPDHEHGEEIDQELFLMAKGREGVERLVGVGAGSSETREGWNFWRA